MKEIIEDQVWRAERENGKQIKRYFEQEKEYINSGHKDFAINFERKQIPVKYSDQQFQGYNRVGLTDRAQNNIAQKFAEKIEDEAKIIPQESFEDEAQLIGQTADEKLPFGDITNTINAVAPGAVGGTAKFIGQMAEGNVSVSDITKTIKTVAPGPVGDTAHVVGNVIEKGIDAAVGVAELASGLAGGAGGIVSGVKLVKDLTGHGKPTFETKESGPSELNILNFKNDSEKREDFYKLSKFNGDIWEDDAIILEGSLKHLQIIQDSLSDKLPKIIHYEIFHSTKIFVEQELTNALMAEWKQNKDIMSSNESQREQRKKLLNDIEKNEYALDIINGMTRMIKNFQNQEKQLHHQGRSDEYEEEMDEKHLQFSEDKSWHSGDV